MIIIPGLNEKKNNNGWIFASFDISCVSQADWARPQTCCVENRYRRWIMGLIIKTHTGG